MQTKHQTINIMDTTTCSHTEAIARDLYILYRTDIAPLADIDWDDLPGQEQQAWLKIAGNLLPVLGHHALGDLAAYTKRKLRETTSTGKKILWSLITAAVLAAAAWLTALGFAGCGHTIDVSRENGLVICKDGTCLIIRDGRITYGVQPPKNTIPVNPDAK